MRKKSLTLACIFIIFDQIIKVFINNAFYYGEHAAIVNNFFYITKVHNFGAAWSMFEGGRYLLIIIAVCSFMLLFHYEKFFRYKERTVFGFALVYGGLFGNLIDRFYLGFVIDYMEFIFGNYHFPIFNLADMCLVSGFILLMYAIARGEDIYVHKKR